MRRLWKWLRAEFVSKPTTALISIVIGIMWGTLELLRGGLPSRAEGIRIGVAILITAALVSVVLRTKLRDRDLLQSLVEQRFARSRASKHIPTLPSVAWSRAVEPVLDTAESLEHLRTRFGYRVRLLPGAEPDLLMLETSLSWSAIQVEQVDMYCVTLARSADALDKEYSQSGVLMRELSELEPTIWPSVRDLCSIRLKTRGRRTVEPESVDVSDELIRFWFPQEETIGLGELGEFVVSASFPVPSSLTIFPFFTGDYFITDGFLLEFDAGQVEGFSHYFNYLSRGKALERGAWEFPRQGKDSFTFQASRDVLIWPRSGIVFY